MFNKRKIQHLEYKLESLKIVNNTLTERVTSLIDEKEKLNREVFRLKNQLHKERKKNEKAMEVR